MTTKTTKIDYSKPVLWKQSTDCGEPVAIRNATPAEVQASRDAGDEGYIEVADIGTCYVEE